MWPADYRTLQGLIKGERHGGVALSLFKKLMLKSLNCIGLLVLAVMLGISYRIPRTVCIGGTEQWCGSLWIQCARGEERAIEKERLIRPLRHRG